MRKKPKIIVALLAVLLFPNPAWPQPVTCAISANYACEVGGCNQSQGSVRNILDLSRQTYARCDAQGCDTYDARYSRSGAFIVVDVPGFGITAKLATGMTAFLEVAIKGTTALVSFGSCQ
jgi:hypothetical protein